MPEDNSPGYEPGVLRVFQSKDETKAFYNKIAKVYDLLAEHSEQPMCTSASRCSQPARVRRSWRLVSAPDIAWLSSHKRSARRVTSWASTCRRAWWQMRQLIQDAGSEDRIALHCGDAARLPFEADSIDGIFTSFTLELFDTPELPDVLAEWKRVLRPGGRLAVVAISKEGKQGIVMRAYEWTHRHFPNLMDCRPIFVSRAMEAVGFAIHDKKIEHMWVPVEIVLGIKPA